MPIVYRFFLNVNPTSTGDGLAPIEAPAQQNQLPLEPVGRRKSPARQRRYWGRIKPGIVGALQNTPLGDSQGWRSPLEQAFGTFPLGEKYIPRPPAGGQNPPVPRTGDERGKKSNKEE